MLWTLLRFILANGDGEIRTLDPLLARQVLSQLSYTPIYGFFHILFFNLAATYLPVPSPAKYFRPPSS